jgi:hypothetical protein
VSVVTVSATDSATIPLTGAVTFAIAVDGGVVSSAVVSRD